MSNTGNYGSPRRVLKYAVPSEDVLGGMDRKAEGLSDTRRYRVCPTTRRDARPVRHSRDMVFQQSPSLTAVVRRSVVWAAGLSGLAVLAVVVGVPGVMGAVSLGRLSAVWWWSTGLLAGVAGLAAVLAGLAWSVRRWLPAPVDPAGSRAGAVVRALVTVGAVILGSGAVAGLVSVVIYLAGGQAWEQDLLVSVIDGVGLGCAVGVAPVVFTLLVVGARGFNVWRRPVWRVVRGVYLRLLVVTGVSAGLGLGVAQLAARLPGVWGTLAYAVPVALFGAVALVVGLWVVVGRAWLAGAPVRRHRSGRSGRSRRVWARWAPRLAGVVVVVTASALVFSLSSAVVAEATPGAEPEPAPSATPSPQVGDPTNTEPGSPVPDAGSSKDPYAWYDVPEAPETVYAAGDNWVTYQTGPESYRTVLGGVQQTYVDEQGDLQLVDNRFVPDPGSGALVNAGNDFKVAVPVSGDDRGIVFSRDGYSMTLTPSAGDFSRVVSKDNAVLFSNVFDGVDVQYSLVGSVVKEDVVVTRAIEVPKWSFTVSVDGGLVLGSESEGSLAARAGEAHTGVEPGEVVFALSAPAMIDAANAFSDAVTMTAEVRDNTAQVSVTADQDWISDIERVFPVRIDPTVDIAPSAVTLVGVEEGSPDQLIGDNGYPYAGYDDGIVSLNLKNFNEAHLKTRTYVGIKYDFQNIMKNATIDSAKFSLSQMTKWSNGKTVFDLHTVDQAWDPGVITWNKQLNVTGTLVGSVPASPDAGTLTWDVRQVVNDWVQGNKAQNGFRVQAQDERNMQAEVFLNKASARPPQFEINYTVTEPPAPDQSLDATTINVRAVTETNQDGKRIVDGVFADGLAKPGSTVAYQLNPAGDSGTADAATTLKYPDSSGWDASYPNATKYADQVSNWQTGLYSKLDAGVEYQFQAAASMGGATGATVTSDRFLVYQVRATDTLPFIARWYGVPLATLMADNGLDGILANSGKTLFIRNPNTTTTYTPAVMTPDQKKQIKPNLMGMGMHCEYALEPVNMNTGDFWLDISDVTIPDLKSSFGVTRSYNSLGDKPQSVFGYGWQFEYAQHLSLDDGELLWSAPDGKVVPFEAGGPDTYASPEGFNKTIKAIGFEAGGKAYTRYEMTDTAGTVWSFNQWGLLTSVTDSLGLATTMTYDADNNLATVTAPSAVTIGLGYDKHGRVTSVTRPDGVVLKYTYSDAGDLVSMTDGNGNTVSYTYDDAHLMVSWTDQNGVVAVTNTFDETGRVLTQKDALGNKSTMAYSKGQTVSTDPLGNATIYALDDQGRTTGITYPDGYHVERTYGPNNTLVKDENGTYTYDDAGNQLTSTDVNGNTTRYTYTDANKVATMTDADGRTTTYTYDAAGNLLSTARPGGTDRYTWDDLYRVSSHTDGKGATESFTYQDKSPSPATRTDFTGGVWTNQYNPMRQITSMVDPLGNTTRWIYDRAGNQTGYQAADGAYTETVRDRVGNQIKTVDPKGAATTNTYDAMRNVLTITDPDGHTTTKTYDANSNLLTETNPLGATTTNSYDKRGRLVKSVDAMGGVWSYAYDDLGNVTSVTDPVGGQTVSTYNQALGARTSVSDPTGRTESWTYSPAGKMTSWTDVSGQKTTYEYGADGRVWRTSEPGGSVTETTYDQAGNAIKTRVNDNETTSVYDGANHLVKSVDPAGQTASYTYDRAGRQVSVTNEAGQTTTYTLDPVGRTLTSTDGAGGVVKQAYDKAGNLVATTDAVGNTTTYAYDATNQMISRTDAWGAVTTWTWDSAGNQTSMTDPFSAVTKYTYDKLNRTTSVTDPLGRTTSYQMDAAGRVTQATDPAGFAQKTSFDLAGRVTQTVLPNGLVAYYEYDRAGRLASVRNSLGARTFYTYDAASRVASQTDPLGRVATWTYDRDDNLIAQTAFDQLSVTYTYNKLGDTMSTTQAGSGTVNYTRDPMGRTLTQTDPLGAVTRYAYDADGRLTATTDPTGATTTFAYDPQGNLKSTTDGLGQVTTYAYDSGNRPVVVTDAAGHPTSYTYDALGRQSSVTRPEGDQTRYGYDLAGQLVSSTDGLGRKTTYAYEARGLVAAATDPRGSTTSYTYNSTGDVAAVTDPLGRTKQYEYDLGRRMTSMTDAAGARWSYNYDWNNQLVSVTSPLGLTRAWSYDQGGNVTRTADSLGRMASYQWDQLHNLLASTNALGAVTRNTYDANSRLVSTTDAQGNTWGYGYDLAGRRTSQTDPTGSVTRFSYDPLGRLTQAVSPLGATTAYTYDAVGNQASVTDPVGRVTRFGYDGDNRLVTRTDPVGQSTRWAWDAAGQVTQLQDQWGLLTHYVYDESGHMTRVTDRAGNTSSYTYDAAGQLTSVRDGAGAAWQYGYDQAGNLVTVTDPSGKVTRYGYDAESNKTSQISPTGLVQTWTYDPASRLVATTRPGGVTAKYDWDQLNQLMTTSYSTGATANSAYGYDSLGRRIGMGDVTGQSHYSYDSLGRLTLVTQGDGRSVTYTYDRDGRVARIGYPDGTGVDYTYDASGRVVSVTDPAGTARYTYDAAGRVSRLDRPNGTATVYGYDERGSVISVENLGVGGVRISRFDYTYAPSGQIATEKQTWTDKVGTASIARSFNYDKDLRLASYTETGDGQTITVTYTFDVNGNRTGEVRTQPGGVTLERIAYVYDAENRLVSADSTLDGVTRYSYSADGMLTGATNTDTGTVSYEWTAAQRLQAVRAGGTLLMAVSYDGDGNKVFQASARVVAAQPQPKPQPAPAPVYQWRASKWLCGIGPVFWYGFTQATTQQLGGLNGGLSVRVMANVAQGYGRLDVPLPVEKPLDSADLTALNQAGVTAADVRSLSGPVPAVLPAPAGAASTLTWDMTHYVNDVNTSYARVLSEYGAGSSLAADNTYGVSLLDTRSTGASATTGWLDQGASATGYYMMDGRGSVSSVTSASGDVVRSVSYDPWGVPTDWTGATSSSVFGWNGEEYSPVTGLQYLRDRWFSPAMGRFISPDSTPGSAMDTWSWNLYQYGAGDPVNQVDPSGMWPSWNDVKNGVKKVGGAINNKVVKPTVKAVKAGAKVVNDKVVKPSVKWVNNNVVKPVGKAVTNTVTAIGKGVQKGYTAVKNAGVKLKNATQKAYNASKEWVQEKGQQLKEGVKTAVNTVTTGVSDAYNWTKETASDAWQATKKTVSEAYEWSKDQLSKVNWKVVGEAALIVGGIALTVATAGAAGPVVATIMIAGTVASTAVGVNDIVAETTGTNFIKDTICSGSSKCYAAIELTTAAVSMVGPGGASGLLRGASKAEDVVGAARAAKGGEAVATTTARSAKVAEGTEAASTAGRAARTTETTTSAAQSTAAGTRAAETTATTTRAATTATQTTAKAARAENVAEASSTAARTESVAQSTSTVARTERVAESSSGASRGAGTAERVADKAKSCLRSFTAETVVLMGDGTQEPIGDVQVGDKVMSYDPSTGEQSVQTVTATWPHKDTVVSLTLSDGTVVETTASHPWWVESKRSYIRTDKLHAGDQVLTADGSTLTVSGMSDPQGSQDVYNLTITGPHTYYVSTSNVLVHNTGKPVCFDDLPEDLQAAVRQAETRAAEIHSALDDPIAESMRTSSVVVTEDGKNVLGAGAKRDLSPKQRKAAGPDEILAKEPGAHGEPTALHETYSRGLDPRAIAATRDFCPWCENILRDSGATIIDPRTAVWLPEVP